jgi:hypothetical protein
MSIPAWQASIEEETYFVALQVSESYRPAPSWDGAYCQRLSYSGGLKTRNNCNSGSLDTTPATVFGLDTARGGCHYEEDRRTWTHWEVWAVRSLRWQGHGSQWLHPLWQRVSAITVYHHRDWEIQAWGWASGLLSGTASLLNPDPADHTISPASSLPQGDLLLGGIWKLWDQQEEKSGQQGVRLWRAQWSVARREPIICVSLQRLRDPSPHPREDCCLSAEPRSSRLLFPKLPPSCRVIYCWRITESSETCRQSMGVSLVLSLPCRSQGSFCSAHSLMHSGETPWLKPLPLLGEQMGVWSEREATQPTDCKTC